MKETNF